MKHYIYTGFIAAAVLLASCGKKNEENAAEDQHSEAGHNHEAGESKVKEVELNTAQYKASGIELGTFSMKNLSEVVNANGYTELPPQNQADVSVHLGGMVSDIKVIEGQHVNKGQVVAVLDSPEYARLQEAYTTSKSNLEFLEQEFARQKTLSDENVNSKKVYQRTKSDYEIEKARFASLQKQLTLLNLSKTGTTSSVPLLAPISGYVTEVNIKIGSNAEVGKPLLSIVDNSHLHVDLLVYEKDLYKVKPGQDVHFVLTNHNNKEIKGKVFNVSKSFENDTKSVAVHADIVNKAQELIPGMYVNALIDVGAQKVQALPEEAIVKADGREYIFVLEAEAEHHEEHEEHEEHEGHEEGDEHDHADEHAAEGGAFHFQRIEVKTGTRELGFVQVTPLQSLDTDAQIVLKGAYYIQSHLIKSQGGGGHHH